MDSLSQRAIMLHGHIDDEAKSFNGDYSRIFLVGYSQGGMLSLWAGLNYNRKLGGIVALHSIEPVIHLDSRISKFCSHTPVYHIHGEEDKVLAYEFAKMGEVKVSKELSCGPYELITERRVGHELTDNTLQLATKWLSDKIDEIN
jgi:phospholipase/carboxylesterase